VSDIYWSGYQSTDMDSNEGWYGGVRPGPNDRACFDPSAPGWSEPPAGCSSAFTVGGFRQSGVDVTGTSGIGNLTVNGSVETWNVSCNAGAFNAASAITGYSVGGDEYGSGDIDFTPKGTCSQGVSIQHNGSMYRRFTIRLYGTYSGTINVAGSGDGGAGDAVDFAGTFTGACVVNHNPSGSVRVRGTGTLSGTLNMLSGDFGGGDTYSPDSGGAWAVCHWYGGQWYAGSPAEVHFLGGVTWYLVQGFSIAVVYDYRAGEQVFDGTYFPIDIGVLYLMVAACQPKLVAGAGGSMKVDASRLPSPAPSVGVPFSV